MRIVLVFCVVESKLQIAIKVFSRRSVFMLFWFMFLALVVGTSSFLLVDGEFSVGVLSSAMATFEKNEVMLGVRSITITKIVGKNFVTNRTCIRLGFKNWH